MGDETLSPARNFTITTEDRVRALAGPPAWMRRLRAIEDLEAALLARVRGYFASGGTAGDVQRAAEEDGTRRDLARLNELIDRHNRYYPMEANLPIHPPTGALVERGGVPWRPRAAWSIERLVREGASRI